MKQAFIESADDILWLKQTALKGVIICSAYADFKFAILQGNEDAPHAVNLYKDKNPDFNDDYFRYVFHPEAGVYCVGLEYDGKTDKPKGGFSHIKGAA